MRQAGAQLLLRRGPIQETLLEVAKETQAKGVFWNRRYEPGAASQDRMIEQALLTEGFEVCTGNSALLHEPDSIRNRQGKPFQVFTPFWRHCLTLPDPPDPLPAPTRWPRPSRWPTSMTLGELALEPTPDWAGGLRGAWEPGEAGAQRQLHAFIATGLSAYAEERNRPDHSGTSRLSPHLHFGEIGPRQIWQALRRADEGKRAPSSKWRQSVFLAEVGWREFAHHLLWHFPHTPDEPLRESFRRFPWQSNALWLRAWQRGRTGYPIVDAGMRELWHTGWMHNRVRMIAASFLVKDLRLSWQKGTRWFWDTLVDADLAQNTLGWQWTAGCGADAAPFFRIFNPVTQGEKFDPEGSYVRQWLPELRNLPNRWIHRPFDATPEALQSAGVSLGETYPRPLVPHGIARQAALEAYQRIRSSGSS